MLSLSVSVASRETERSAKVPDVSTPPFPTTDDVVGECGLCARVWAVSDVRDEIRAHKIFKWLFMLGMAGARNQKRRGQRLCAAKGLARFFANPGTFLTSIMHIPTNPEVRAARNAS